MTDRVPLDGHYEIGHLADDFARDGHVCVRALASSEEIGAHRPAIEAAVEAGRHDHRALSERDTYGRAFIQVHNLWQRDPLCADFVLSARFGRVAAELLGVNGVRLYHDQALFKEAGGGHTPWHQDMNYWPLDTDRTVTMWMPLVDVPDEVGSMTFVSGSHLDGDVGAGDISDTSHREIARRLAADDRPLHSHGAMAAGDATFHAGWTLHSAGPNPTDRMRSVMTVIYVADGTRISDPTPEQEFDLRLWLGGRGPGELVDSPLNPRIWPPG